MWFLWGHWEAIWARGRNSPEGPTQRDRNVIKWWFSGVSVFRVLQPSWNKCLCFTSQFTVQGSGTENQQCSCLLLFLLPCVSQEGSAFLCLWWGGFAGRWLAKGKSLWENWLGTRTQNSGVKGSILVKLPSAEGRRVEASFCASLATPSHFPYLFGCLSATLRVLQSSLIQEMCFSIWVLCAPLSWWQCVCETLFPLQPCLLCCSCLPLSMTGCRKGIFGLVLTPFWVWSGQSDPAHPNTAKMHVREEM